MLPSCPPWQPDQASDPTEDRRSYTTPRGTIHLPQPATQRSAERHTHWPAMLDKGGVMAKPPSIRLWQLPQPCSHGLVPARRPIECRWKLLDTTVPRSVAL